MALKFGREGPIGEAGNLDGRKPPLAGSVSVVGGTELRRLDVGKRNVDFGRRGAERPSPSRG